MAFDLCVHQMLRNRPMVPEIQLQLNDLHERVKRLERISTKTNRGRTNQRGAANYLGRSREYLRQLHLRGAGPRRAADGSYSFDDLDAFAEQDVPTAQSISNSE
jgi:hypothetical protein